MCGGSGADAFLLEALFRNDAWGHVLKPISEPNERSVFVSMIEGCRCVGYWCCSVMSTPATCMPPQATVRLPHVCFHMEGCRSMDH